MVFYTDGSARPSNPGPAGFGVAVVDDNDTLIDSYVKKFDWSTNNRMEMLAICDAVLYAAERGQKNITIYSDSAYAINSFTQWRPGWKRNGWIKSDKKVPENLDIIKVYDELDSLYNINLIKVKGHTGKNDWNDYVDKMIWGD